MRIASEANAQGLAHLGLRDALQTLAEPRESGLVGETEEVDAEVVVSPVTGEPVSDRRACSSPKSARACRFGSRASPPCGSAPSMLKFAEICEFARLANPPRGGELAILRAGSATRCGFRRQPRRPPLQRRAGGRLGTASSASTSRMGNPTRVSDLRPRGRFQSPRAGPRPPMGPASREARACAFGRHGSIAASRAPTPNSTASSTTPS